MEEIVISQKETPFEKRAYDKFHFPAITVREGRIYLNRLALNFFDGHRISLSTAGEYIIFRPTDSMRGFNINRHKRSSAYIASVQLIRSVPLKVGASYKLCVVKGGGYAINAYQPLDK